MKQVIRSNTFETNSSSTHSLILVDKETFNKFKNKELYFYIGTDSFIEKGDIVKLSEFEDDYPDYQTFSADELKDAIEDFINTYTDCDYPVLGTLTSIDSRTQEVYDKDGNEQVALSYYIPG